MHFKDHFTGIGRNYQRYRPTYPEELFDWMHQLAGGDACVWDCATGNGQAAIELSKRFSQIIATDGSADQIANAHAHPNIDYRVATAENSGLPDQSVDLITVAQALHWFDFDAFYDEVRRVADPNATLVVWSYGFLRSGEEELDALIHHFTREVLGPWWPPERVLVDHGYREIPFPFEKMSVPSLEMTTHWDLADTLGYLSTSSARKRYLNEAGVDPLEYLRSAFERAWGDPERKRTLSWPMVVLAGRVSR